MTEPNKIRQDYKHHGHRSRRDRPSRHWRLRWAALVLCSIALGVVMANSRDPVTVNAPLALHAVGGLKQVELTLPRHLARTVPADGDRVMDDAEWKSLSVESGDSLARLLRGEGISHQTVHELVSTSEHGNQLANLRPGESIRLALNDDGRLAALVHEISPERGIRFERDDDGFASREVERELQRRLEHASGTVKTSLFAAASAAGLSHRTTMEMAAIFGWDIDFALDLRRGDSFRVIHEAFYRDGQHVRDGDIVAAEFINAGRSYRALRYTNPDGETDYFAPDGKSMRRAFLRAPVEYTRITSGFGPRQHPKLHSMRNHNGVDYAAPTGTPIRATGDGRIVAREWRGGYGRTVVLQHGERYRTLYAHLSDFHARRGAGTRVSQGDIIGYVGASGLATGPHVHYELLVDDRHRDPQTVELPSGEPVDDAHRDHFRQQTRPLLAQLDTLRRTDHAARGGAIATR